MTRVLVTDSSPEVSAPFVPRKRRRTKEEMQAAKREVEQALANAPIAPDPIEAQPLENVLISRIPDEIPTPELDSDFKGEILEFHQPVELMGNQKTLSHQRSVMTRLKDGSGDWVIQSKKTKNRYLVGGGNIKAAKLK